MVKITLKTFLVIFFLLLFLDVLFNVSYPNSLTEASLFVSVAFFVPLFLLVIFLIDIFIDSIFISSSISLGLIILLLLKGLDSLNLISAILIVVTSGLFISYFAKNKKKVVQPIKGSNPIKLSGAAKINIPRLKILQKKK